MTKKREYILSKKERHEIYRMAKSLLTISVNTNSLHKSDGLCYYLNIAMEELKYPDDLCLDVWPYDHMDEFPEIWRRRPKWVTLQLCSQAYWFDNWQVRLEILNSAIKYTSLNNL